MLTSSATRKKIALASRFIAVVVIALLAYFIYRGPTAHVRGGLVGLAGALLLVVPPLRQAFRNHLFDLPKPGAALLPSDVQREAERQQLLAFAEFSLLDVCCLVAGPLCLAGGYLIDVLFE
jgi:hypothetical protein